MLRSGADKVSINTAAIENPNLITKSAKKFGSQSIVVAIDAKRNGNDWQVYSHGGNKPTNLSAANWAEEVVKLGAGELLVTSMDADGRKSGYDLDLLSSIKKRVNVPVIASGGGGEPEHLFDAISLANVDAVLLASILHFGNYRIIDLKEYLNKKKISIRI